MVREKLGQDEEERESPNSRMKSKRLGSGKANRMNKRPFLKILLQKGLKLKTPHDEEGLAAWEKLSEEASSSSERDLQISGDATRTQ